MININVVMDKITYKNLTVAVSSVIGVTAGVNKNDSTKNSNIGKARRRKS